MQNKSTFFIVGKHPVLEALRNPRRKILKIFLTEESKKLIHRSSPNKDLLKDKKISIKEKEFRAQQKGALMLSNLFIFLAFYSSDLNDNQRIDSDGMIERTYYLEQYRQEDQPSFSDAFRAARKELGPGKIFMWNNRYFTTNFYYETIIVIADEVVDVNKEDKTYSSEEKLGDIVAVRSFKDSDKYEIEYTFLNKITK